MSRLIKVIVTDEINNQTGGKLKFGESTIEGKGENGWILLDYNGLIVNIMTREIREYYDLEGLWSKGTELLRIQ